VQAEGDLVLCVNGVHACRAHALPRWLDAELWRVELDGVASELEGVAVARRGRLLERVDAWDASMSRELARWCAQRARKLADEHPDPSIQRMAEDIGGMAKGPDQGGAALAAHCTARAAEVAFAGGYEAERRRQAEWLRDRLRLDGQAGRRSAVRLGWLRRLSRRRGKP
jgi:hypothetical protein